MSRHHHKLSGHRWERARRACFDRDDWRCRRCGKPGKLEAHHPVPLSEGGDPYVLDNLETVCKECHKASHRRLRTDGEQSWAALIADACNSAILVLDSP